MSDHAKWIEVFRTTDQVEAEFIKGLLSTNGFPVIMEATGGKSMATFLGHSSFGQLILRVAPDMAPLAQELLAAQVEEPAEE